MSAATPSLDDIDLDALLQELHLSDANRLVDIDLDELLDGLSTMTTDAQTAVSGGGTSQRDESDQESDDDDDDIPSDETPATLTTVQPYVPTPGIEQWRTIPGYSEYQVSDWGNLKGKKGQLMSIKLNPGHYPRVCISPKELGTEKKHYVHTLVSWAFHSRKQDATSIDHIDRNVHNCHASNLRWATVAENLANRAEHANRRRSRQVEKLGADGSVTAVYESILEASQSTGISIDRIKYQLRRTGGSTQWRYHVDGDLPGEQWANVVYNDLRATVSSLGRIDVNGVKTYGRLAKDKGYMLWSNTGIHILVATAFIPNPHDHPLVNHLDGNKTNNCVSNLEWTTPRGNTEHAIATGLVTGLRPVVQCNEVSGAIINRYPSIAEASRQTGIQCRHIGIVCDGSDPARRRAGGYFWQYADNIPETAVMVHNPPGRAADRSAKRISQHLAPDSPAERFFDSMYRAQAETGIRNISRAIANRTKAGGFYWKYA